MLRSIPPHLFVLVTLFVFVIWIMLVHRFRKSAAIQRFVAEALGDDTPQAALRAFEMAKRRLTVHLDSADLDPMTRQQMQLAIGWRVEGEQVHGHTDDRSV